MRSNFYCQKVCGDGNFSIEEWNKAFKMCMEMNLSEKETAKILEGDTTHCIEQCFYCMAIVRYRQKKTKQ